MLAAIATLSGGCYAIGPALQAGSQGFVDAHNGAQQQAPAARPLVTCTQTRSGNAVYTNCSDGSGCMTTYNGGQGFTTCH